MVIAPPMDLQQPLHTQHMDTIQAFPWTLEWFAEETVMASLHWQTVQPLLTEKLPQALTHLKAALTTEAPQNSLWGRAQHQWPDTPNADSVWEVDLSITANDTIQVLNRDFRQKAQPTDVLSFPQWTPGDPVPTLPEFSLGSIVVSMEWALAHAGHELEDDPNSPEAQQALASFIIERTCHGLLHLMGIHHDTMDDYQRVKAIQQQVLHGIF